ncbi:MAG: polymer-forming cytoskeletal protein [Deltaproteobacteria bacterium]|nr:polymer-forming cytoskeletal protein [Deltaproteobacteria bacterium]
MFREKEDLRDDVRSDVEITDATNATVLKKDACFEGKLVFEGHVVIDGKFKGEIFSSGELAVGKSGYLEGNVEIGTIVVHGEVKGNIKAKNKIVINAPAQVRGDIVAPSLTIDEGAVFEGNCSMGKDIARNNLRSNVVGLPKTADQDY